MKLKTKKIMMMLMFNILLSMSFYSLNMEKVHTHEMAHKEIAENHGCIDWEINQTVTGKGTFQCLKYANTNEQIQIQEQLLHSINEIIGYNLSTLISAISIICLLLMNTIFMRWIKDE